ncbi:MAG: Polyketide cyclase/dehydrase [Thermoleophilia bacterium]|nr:Polyketide cyclase/dehydrase [Thermoleophilia bacterium]
MPGAIETRHVGVRIERTADAVYHYARSPEHLPDWAAGLAGGAVEEVDGSWIVESPMGRVGIAFADDNAFGVLDHVVTLPDGVAVMNPLRVLADGASCDVVFTVRHRPGVSSPDFERDVSAIAADLATLKQLLETDPHG